MVRKNDDGLLIRPREALVMKLLDEIGQALKEKGITLEKLLEDGEAIRTELIREKYGLGDENS